jgi:hypothetical protein
VFCSFTSEQAARNVMKALPGDMKGFVAAGVDRHPLKGLAEG